MFLPWSFNQFLAQTLKRELKVIVLRDHYLPYTGCAKQQLDSLMKYVLSSLC